MAYIRQGDGEGEEVSKYVTATGWAIVPPRIAHWLEAKAKVTADLRGRLRDTDWDAHQVLTALHVVALRYARSDIGTKPPVGHSCRAESEVWVSTSEAAAELNVTDRCIRNWIYAKRLPATKPGGRWLINRNDIDVHKLTT